MAISVKNAKENCNIAVMNFYHCAYQWHDAVSCSYYSSSVLTLYSVQYTDRPSLMMHN